MIFDEVNYYMANVVKKGILLLLSTLLVGCLICGCGETAQNKKKMENKMDSVMEMIKLRDSQALYNSFSVELKDGNEDKLKRQIEELFTFIDGEIAEYTFYMEASLEEEKQKGKDILYYARHEYKYVKEGSDSEYIISIGYYLINETGPNKIGVDTIDIYHSTLEEKIHIGRN